MNYGVVVGPSGRVEHHVFHIPPSPDRGPDRDEPFGRSFDRAAPRRFGRSPLPSARLDHRIGRPTIASGPCP